jgi:tryptophanyl-tRNA synthetase
VVGESIKKLAKQFNRDVAPAASTENLTDELHAWMGNDEAIEISKLANLRTFEAVLAAGDAKNLMIYEQLKVSQVYALAYYNLRAQNGNYR